VSDPIRPCITGMGVITPIGQDLDSFWGALLTGRCGSAPIRSFDVSGFKSGIGCEVGDYALPAALRPHILGGRCTEFALLAVSQAVAQSGIEPLLRGSRDTAVVVGTTMGDLTLFEQQRAAHTDRRADERELAALASRPLDIMGRSVASLYELAGPVTTTPTACAAGAYAVGLAAAMVARRRVTRAIAVGCEAFSRLAFAGFTRLGAMSPDFCRPFSRDRRGLLLGEGAAAVIIESAAAAGARGTDVLAVVDGLGLSCDAHHITGPHPEGAGAVRAMTGALHEGRLAPADVDYINAHGTGTHLNDKVESLAVRKVFAGSPGALPVSSIKALTGHMMGAAGCVEAVASVLALRHGIIPPTWNWLGEDPECGIDCVPNEPREKPLRHVLSNSYAFGGNNASLLLSAPRGSAAS
jgi:3-oxoacyl-[acyl-carrier-protein] synthase II